jgi:protein-S-isoprenylcysteine O-methyltransferase Ste14
MATLRRNVIVSVLFTLFGGPGFVLVYLPFWITRFRIPAGEPCWQTLVAGALIAAGLGPLLDSICRFIYAGRGTLMPTVPTEHLVVSGMYRYVRNPMYTGVLFALAGEVILFESRRLAVYAAVVWFAVHLFVRFYEEPTLARRYGDEFSTFRRNVPRWLPRLRAWKGADE